MIKLKIVLGGESGVGKSSFLHRFAHGTFPLRDLYGTLGFDFTSRDVIIKNRVVKLAIFDFGGEEKFQELFAQYAEGAHAIILAFDSSDMSTLDRLHRWIEVLQRRQNVPIILISTKHDLGYEVDLSKVDDFCRKYNISTYIQTSALLAQNVYETFQEAARQALSAFGFNIDQ